LAKEKDQKKKNQTLTGAQKVRVVQCLARFMTPTEVSALLKEDYDLEVDRQAVEKYDPTKSAGDKLSEKLKEIFKETRTRFIADIESIDVSHQSFRLRELSSLYHDAKERGAIAAAAKFLTQVAKEKGGYYTNKREHSGPNGGAIPLDVGSKRKELAAQMLRKLIDKGKSEEEARASLIAMGVNESDLPAIQ
jgi:hypothetical protein